MSHPPRPSWDPWVSGLPDWEVAAVDQMKAAFPDLAVGWIIFCVRAHFADERDPRTTVPLVRSHTLIKIREKLMSMRASCVLTKDDQLEKLDSMFPLHPKQLLKDAIVSSGRNLNLASALLEGTDNTEDTSTLTGHPACFGQNGFLSPAVNKPALAALTWFAAPDDDSRSFFRGTFRNGKFHRIQKIPLGTFLGISA